MFLDAPLGAALDRIAERAADVRRAFVPGAVPEHDDVATPAASSAFTLDPLSVRAPEGTYFLTAGARGETRYSRDGAFAIRDGRLVDGSGSPVLGTLPSGERGELRADAVDAALGRIAGASIRPDGTLAYRRTTTDPRTGERESRQIVVGRLLVARFPAGTRLDARDDDSGAAPAGVAADVGSPGEGRFARVVPMQRERSRVDLDESLARLKEAYVAFEAMQAAQTARGRLGKTAMDLLK